MAAKKGSRKPGTEQAPAILTIIPDWADAAILAPGEGASR